MAGRLRRRQQHIQDDGQVKPSVNPVGGRFRPLSDRDVVAIHDAAFRILESVGMSDAPSWLLEVFCDNGAVIRNDGRVTFPRASVEKAIRNAAQKISIPGFVEDKGVQIGGGRVHIGTGGAAVQVLDSGSNAFRASTLGDLYELMRVVDQAENIDYGVRPVVARDVETPLDLDVNTAFACLKGTGKPIGIGFDNAGHVSPIVNLFDIALGRDGAFRRHPFCMAIVVHAVSPLRYAAEGVEIMRAAIEHGMPLQICSAGQAGATSPASLAGALAQGLAESLAGMMVVDAIRPGHPCIFAFMPFISDLRTGAMSGGGGESAVANAAAAQLLLALNLPSTVSAGMTDSKIADAQAGYEKGYTVALAAQAGADMINLSVGMLGSIMIASREMMVIDDEMCGAILRSVRGIELFEGALDIGGIEQVVTGAGHYLGEEQTLQLMKTEYTYPALGDRQSLNDWQDGGSSSIWDRAHDRVLEMMNRPQEHLGRDAEERIRGTFDIRLGP